jgi:F0F1-type ATP synthase alpha subunit
MTQLVQKVIVHAQAISNLLKSPDFDPGALKDNIYAVVSFSKEFSRYLRNEQHRKLISLRIRTLLEKAIEMLQNLSTNTASNRDSVLILTATTELLRALTFAINNSK